MVYRHGTRETEVLSPNGYETLPLRGHPDLDRGQERMPQPGVPALIWIRRVEPEIVENGRPAGRQQPDRRLDIVPRIARIDEQEVELAKYMPIVLVNPQLKLSKEKEAGTEGCLSFPEMTAEITRASGVRCKAQLLDGSTIEFDAAGLLARALQHEVDHLHGVLFIDRMSSAARAGLAGKLKRLQREARP